jgi:hypothetical protein
MFPPLRQSYQIIVNRVILKFVVKRSLFSTLPLAYLSREIYREYIASVILVKLSLCFNEDHAMKAYWWSGGITP